MAYVHVAHECELGDNNTIANSVQLAGHVTIGNNTNIGACAACTSSCASAIMP